MKNISGINLNSRHQAQLLWVAALVLVALCLGHSWLFQFNQQEQAFDHLNMRILSLTPPGLTLELNEFSHPAVDLRFHPMLQETGIESVMIGFDSNKSREDWPPGSEGDRNNKQ